MALFQTADGRWIVGGNRSGSEYKGFLGWRDCVIQLTASGATEESIDYLNAFRDYALAHNALGEPIMPSSVNVWISNNGTTTAVQADDLSVEGNSFTIGGIKWTGSAWDCSNAGQGSGGSGGGSGSGSLVVTLSGDKKTADKTFKEIGDALASGRGAVAISPSDADWTNNPQYQPFVYVKFGKKGVVAAYVTFSTSGTSELHTSVNSDAGASGYPEFEEGDS